MSAGVREEGVTFSCRGEQLVGILHRGSGARGVLVLVGGPQYRVGSHRQFTLLARRLAAQGIPVLRFDCRGLGDSAGTRAGFEHISEDIDAAVAAFATLEEGLEDVVIWALCDAVSAALLHPKLPALVTGLVLLNPWVTEAEVGDETLIRHYYLRRAFSAGFWHKLLSGRLSGMRSARELTSAVAGALRTRLTGGDGEEGDTSLAERMKRGLGRFSGQVLLITSGQDLTAGEFLNVVRGDKRWQSLLAEARVRREHLPDANHTFSSARWREQVETLTLGWLRSW